ncbi:twin-arginine translocation signal domain-containing protein [Viscerimonas tarda]
MEENKNSLSRRKFLRTCGSIVAAGTVVGVSGVLLKKSQSESQALSSGDLRPAEQGAFTSPYRQIATFATPGVVEGFELYNDQLYVAASNIVSVFDHYGKLLQRFSSGETIRDMAVNDNGIYILYTTKIKVFSHAGELLREWEACSELSGYCSLALAEEFVFVTDVLNKNICKYTKEGSFVQFINSPNGFVIPSYTFPIEYVDGVLYCANSGRHQVESYTLDGKYLGTFGKAGGDPGLFTGCCNPVYLTCTANGEIITSEKGDPRISCYGSDGTFRNILIDSKSLGGGNSAYDVKVQKDKIFIAGKSKVSVFRYDELLAANDGCPGCGIDCPLKV